MNFCALIAAAIQQAPTPEIAASLQEIRDTACPKSGTVEPQSGGGGGDKPPTTGTPGGH